MIIKAVRIPNLLQWKISLSTGSLHRYTTGIPKHGGATRAMSSLVNIQTTSQQSWLWNDMMTPGSKERRLLALRNRMNGNRMNGMNRGHQSVFGFRFFATSSDKNDESTLPPKQTEETGDDNDDSALVYESPYGGTVLRLRMISWFTGFAGALGFPLSYASKGGDPATVSFWLMSGFFGLATMSTTFVIIYVFRPYVYQIERVPMRKCHYPKSTNEDSETASSETDEPKPTAAQHYLYMATTRSFFLFQEQTFFDPEKDLYPYSGITQPLCNLKIVSKDGKESLFYVHPEICYDNAISKVLAIPDPDDIADKGSQQVIQKQVNPDDQLKS